MLLIIDDGRCKRHGTRHPDMSQGDKEGFPFLRRNDMAHDAAFVAGIRQVRDDLACLSAMATSSWRYLTSGGVKSTSKGAAAFNAASKRAVFSGLSSMGVAQVGRRGRESSGSRYSTLRFLRAPVHRHDGTPGHLVLRQGEYLTISRTPARWRRG